MSTETKSNIEYEIEQNNWIGIVTVIKTNKEGDHAIYDIDIRTNYKGSSQITKVQSGFGGPDCGFEFEIDHEYIIYGNVINDSTIETSRCKRTNKLTDTPDVDYLDLEFKNYEEQLHWSESFTNFIQGKLQSQVDISNPPIFLDETYNVLTIKTLVEKHPNYYVITKIHFNSRELKKMKPAVREIAIKRGILLVSNSSFKIKTNKIIKKLGEHYK